MKLTRHIQDIRMDAEYKNREMVGFSYNLLLCTVFYVLFTYCVYIYVLYVFIEDLRRTRSLL